MSERNQELHILWTKEELDRLHRKMDEAGVINQSAYIRKMALDGYIVKLDMHDINEMIRLLRNMANNLNQVAKRVNVGYGIYQNDIKDMKERQEEIWEAARKILEKLSTIK